jgi:hypothetical protein
MKWLRALLKDLVAEDTVDAKEPDPETSKVALGFL